MQASMVLVAHNDHLSALFQQILVNAKHKIYSKIRPKQICTLYKRSDSIYTLYFIAGVIV